MVWVLGARTPLLLRHIRAVDTLVWHSLFTFSHQLYISCFIYFHFLVPIILSLRSALFGKF